MSLMSILNIEVVNIFLVAVLVLLFVWVVIQRNRSRLLKDNEILLTAKSSEVMRIQGIEAGADAYIPKPFSPGELLEKIRSFSKHREDA